MDFNRENFTQLLEHQDELRSENARFKTEIDRIRSENSELEIRLKLLKEKVQYLMNKLFGRKSEKLSPDQMELFLEELQQTHEELEELSEELEQKKEPSRRGKRKPLKERIPEDLPTERVVIIPDEVKAAPESYKKIGEETVEELDVTPTQYFRRIIVREKYVKVDDRAAAPIIAPAPKRLIPNSYASAGLILNIILNKYCDHQPLYRQEMTLKYRHNIEISRKTMGGWMYLIADWLTMIYEALRNEIRQSGYMQIDETFIKYQDPQKDHCPNGYLWAYHSPGTGVLFEWFPSRAADCLDPMLSDYEGYIQTDGYGGYTSWLNQPEHQKEKGAITHAACWAHARRKFVEVPENSNARKIVKLIAKLYRTETELQNTPELKRAADRQQHAAPVLEKIKAILDKEQLRQLPKSNFGKAITYALDRWSELNLYLEHGTLEIDNNLVENAIRPTALGKKNFLFFGSPNSGQTSAVIYSLVETCRKLGINPSEYFKELLDALPTMQQSEAAAWTPSRWSAAQDQSE
jgi:transposase